VGLVVFDVLDPQGNPLPSHRCSGTLLSPTVLLTAGHCTRGTIAARVWFDDDLTRNTEYLLSGSTSYDGVAYTFQDFCADCGDEIPAFAAGDVGLVVLSEPVPGAVVDRYAALPASGLVDRLEDRTALDSVGYGVQPGQGEANAPVWIGFRVRLAAPSTLTEGGFVHADQFVRLAFGAAGEAGGTCFADSGGPDLLKGTDTILAIHSASLNASCTGSGYSARIDTPAVLEWIRSFLQSRKS
jgi:hypothetical protein